MPMPTIWTAMIPTASSLSSPSVALMFCKKRAAKAKTHRMDIAMMHRALMTRGSAQSCTTQIKATYGKKQWKNPWKINGNPQRWMLQLGNLSCHDWSISESYLAVTSIGKNVSESPAFRPLDRCWKSRIDHWMSRVPWRVWRVRALPGLDRYVLFQLFL